ncbi:MAG: hypothetical protein FWF54_03290 [Candidatus Azobacteroides sp.]|nr:hypothetical protein [Candidatus Azobacteroides sp.]
MKFSEKNDFVVKHKNSDFFCRDLELYKKYYPNSELNRELARANSHTSTRLDGQILFELLDKVSPGEILENRTRNENVELKPVAVETVEHVKELFRNAEFDPDKFTEEYLQKFIGKTLDDVKGIIDLLPENTDEDETPSESTGNELPGEVVSSEEENITSEVQKKTKDKK